MPPDGRWDLNWSLRVKGEKCYPVGHVLQVADTVTLTYKSFLREASALAHTKYLSLFVINISPSSKLNLYFATLNTKHAGRSLLDRIFCRMGLTSA